ncbi:hypothetical protein K490DRAFT_69723 [Saccharata proteae CBS 121410]|uniref:Uncharacterized protein n=1 Tax=Saccharata proteae CBS 121410 TaxID=1314787 RepID=A0A9P4HMY8_9PEZI|nr:hypothetical protein K490DRAFT_69723 [Saccharata proteae CBS 121410]
MCYIVPVLVAMGAMTNAAALTNTSRASTGCSINLASTLTTPASPGENILMKTMIKWDSTTGMSEFMSTYCDWSNTSSAPFSVLFYANTIPGYESVADLESVLDTWVGTWLVSDTATPSSGVVGDYNVTSVECS